jgi:hypothetical protein
MGLHSEMASLRRENEQLKSQAERQANQSNQQFSELTCLVKRLLSQAGPPIRNVRTGQVLNQEVAAPVAQNLAPMVPTTLSPVPRTIHALWLEYEFGIGGRKAAKDFSATEIGKSKYSYHRRKVVWDVVAELVWGGWLAEVACDKIYEVYGHQRSVTSIVNSMRKDRTTYNGAHPALRIANL